VISTHKKASTALKKQLMLSCVPIVACESQTRGDILIDKGANVYLSP
jgi:hypothetical protein